MNIGIDAALREAVGQALATLQQATGRNAEELFGERALGELDTLASEAAHAAGIIEGAAIACGLTALDLLDEFDLP